MTRPTFANHDRETRFWLSTRDRADCRPCHGRGWFAVLGPRRESCVDCLGTGKQLSREDYLLLDSQADGEGAAPVEAPAPTSRVGKTVECWDCGTPYVVKHERDNGQCVHCYLALKL
jgi:hypothetical protein